MKMHVLFLIKHVVLHGHPQTWESRGRITRHFIHRAPRIRKGQECEKITICDIVAQSFLETQDGI